MLSLKRSVRANQTIFRENGMGRGFLVIVTGMRGNSGVYVAVAGLCVNSSMGLTVTGLRGAHWKVATYIPL